MVCSDSALGAEGWKGRGAPVETSGFSNTRKARGLCVRTGRTGGGLIDLI
jgi:hypothetical protein